MITVTVPCPTCAQPLRVPLNTTHTQEDGALVVELSADMDGFEVAYLKHLADEAKP